MRFARITPPTAPGAEPRPWIIGDDSKRGPGSRFLVNGWAGFEQVVQSIQYIDATFTRNIALGNRNVEYTFIVDCEFADESECFLFASRLPLDCPVTGALEISCLGKGGANVFYPSAVVSSVTPFDVTVTSMKLRYVIQAGAPG